MYLRTVFGSRPVRRAIAVTDSPCRCSSRNHHQFSKLDHRRRLPREGDGTDVGSTIQPGLAPAEWLAGMPTREFSKPTIGENRRTDDRSGRRSSAIATPPDTKRFGPARRTPRAGSAARRSNRTNLCAVLKAEVDAGGQRAVRLHPLAQAGRHRLAEEPGQPRLHAAGIRNVIHAP